MAAMAALNRFLCAIPMKPFTSHLGRWVVSPWMISLELLIMCRGLLGSSDFVAQHSSVSSPIRQVGFFACILSAIFHSSFSPYHRPLPSLASPSLLTVHAPSRKMVVQCGSFSCLAGLLAVIQHLDFGSMKILKYTSRLEMLHIVGLKVIIPSSFIAFSYSLSLWGVSNRLSLFI